MTLYWISYAQWGSTFIELDGEPTNEQAHAAAARARLLGIEPAGVEEVVILPVPAEHAAETPRDMLNRLVPTAEIIERLDGVRTSSDAVVQAWGGHVEHPKQ